LRGISDFSRCNTKSRNRVRTPEKSRIAVKLAASIAPPPNARRQSTEFAANAIKARLVKRIVLRIGISEFLLLLYQSI